MHTTIIKNTPYKIKKTCDINGTVRLLKSSIFYLTSLPGCSLSQHMIGDSLQKKDAMHLNC